MLKRSNRACTFTNPLTVTEALQSLAPSSSATHRLRGVLEQPSTPPGYATDVVSVTATNECDSPPSEEITVWIDLKGTGVKLLYIYS